MNTDKRWLETRQLLADWFVPVSILLVVVALVSGVAVYSAVATPAEPTEYDTVDHWSTTADLSHSAEVTEPNEVFSVGQTLDDQPRYYTEVMPILEGDIQYSYQAADGEVDVETEITQVTRAVEDGSDGDVVYWRDEQPLDAEQTSELTPSETHNDSFAVDVETMEQNATERAESLGSTAGTLETIIRIDVRMDGTIDGESVEHTETYELPIDVTSGTYTVELPSETGHTEQRTVAVSGGWSDGLGDVVAVLVLILSLGSLVGLAAAKHSEVLAPTAAERRAVETKSQREALDEWISRGALPASVADVPRIEVASLTELVDVAIDSNRRVIDRDDAAEYVVVDDNVLYGFTPEQPETVAEDTVNTQTASAEDEADQPAVESNDESTPSDDRTADNES